MSEHSIRINRAPVLTLWGAVVAEKLGYPWRSALTLGRAIAGLNAQSKGRRLGVFGEGEHHEPERKRATTGSRPRERLVPLLGREVPAVETPQGLRAVAGGSPASVERYLKGKFGDALGPTREAMEELADAYGPRRLEPNAFALYERFRPAIPPGARGWGARGELDLDRLHELAAAARK